jgi:hypothetical protein
METTRVILKYFGKAFMRRFGRGSMGNLPLKKSGGNVV